MSRRPRADAYFLTAWLARLCARAKKASARAQASIIRLVRSQIAWGDFYDVRRFHCARHGCPNDLVCRVPGTKAHEKYQPNAILYDHSVNW